MCPSPGDHGRAVGGNGRPAQRTLLRDAAEPHSPGHLERWALHALRRVLERRAPRSPPAPRRRDRHGHHGRCVRRRGGGPAARPRAPGRPERELLARRRRRPRLLRGDPQGLEGLPALHRPRAARRGRVRGLPADGDGALARAHRRLRVRRAPAPQPRPDGLQQPGGVGGDGGAAPGGARPRPRHRARAGQRVHARRHRLPGALRRDHRLGDGDPQPDGAVARPARAARGAPARRAGDLPRRRLRRAVLGRRPARPCLRGVRPPAVPARRLDRVGSRAPGAACARSPSATA